MKISEAAAAGGIDAATLRFYEAEGVLPDPVRSPSGYRRYDEDDVSLIRFVRRLRALQFPLDDIRQIVELRQKGEAPCGVVRAAMHRESAAIEEKIAELTRVRSELAELIEESESVADTWPSACVCHVVEGSRP